MTIQIEKGSAVSAILDILVEGRGLPENLHNISEQSGFAPSATTAALNLLIKERLVDRMRNGQYRLTDLGLSVISEAPEIRRLNVIQPHPGFSALELATGKLAIGINIHHNDVRIPLWNEFGAKAVVVSGATGSGKTELMSGLMEASLGHYPSMHTWIIDNTRQLSPYWELAQRVGSDFHTDDRRVRGTANDVLRDVIAVQHDRSRLLAEAGSRCWTGPFRTPYLPAGLLVISSLSEARDREFLGLLKLVMKMARKTGIVVATDVPDLSIASFLTDTALRDGFLYGTVLRMRSMDSGLCLDARIGNPDKVDFPSLPSNFSDGQTTAGVGYLPDGKMFRSFWSPGL